MERISKIVNHLLSTHDLIINLAKVNNDASIEVFQSASGITINLTRPKSLNALTTDMIHQIKNYLDSATQQGKTFAIIKSSLEKAFCAGGDIITMAKAAKMNDYEVCATFFRDEYKLDNQIAQYKTNENFTFISFINGITMGGGVGISINASFIVGSENIRLSMPETGIGFFCDVGGSSFLSKLPGAVGTFAALTGYQFSTADLLYCKILTHYCPFDKFSYLEQLIQSSDGSGKAIQSILDSISSEFPFASGAGFIEQYRDDIDFCFDSESIEEILNKLQEHPNLDWAEKILQKLNSKAPISLKVELELLHKAVSMPLEQVLEMEFTVAMRFMQHPDFYEGVRALLIEKDGSPQWTRQLQDITREEIEEFFKRDKNFIYYN